MDADDGAFRPGAGLGDQWSEGCNRTGGQRRLCRFPSVRSADQRRAFARTPAGDAVQFLWDPGGGAGDDRAVRGDRVYCGSADERDRDPDGAGSIAATGPRNGGGRGGELARRRRHDRRRAGGGGGKIGVDIVVWVEAVRSFDAGVGGSRIGGSGHRGELAAGEASGEAGTDGGAAGRVRSNECRVTSDFIAFSRRRSPTELPFRSCNPVRSTVAIRRLSNFVKHFLHFKTTLLTQDPQDFKRWFPRHLPRAYPMASLA